jgi:hypothetical protein
VRVVHLTPAFFSSRRVHAPHGSPEDAALRPVLRQLGRERFPVPGPRDTEVLRTPFQHLWGRPVPGTNLMITYVITAHAINVTSVHPAYRAV